MREDNMAPQAQPQLLWVVVKVESGIPVIAEAYTDERAALAGERNMRRRMNPEDDETGLFGIKVRPARQLPTGKQFG
jgi:hypothetical protein